MVCSHQVNPKTNGLVSLLTTDYLVALKLFPVVCCYGLQDGNVLKLAKTGPIFFKFRCHVFKNHQNNYYN